VHTNAVIFGFTLGVVFAGSYYGVQRVCRVRMYSDLLSRINLWAGTRSSSPRRCRCSPTQAT
jgi:cbb3-type cytochrome oxidase subunit 1